MFSEPKGIESDPLSREERAVHIPKSNPLLHIPEAGRNKILRTLKKDLVKNGNSMHVETKKQTLTSIINLEEAHVEEIIGRPLLTSDQFDEIPTIDELAELKSRYSGWRNTEPQSYSDTVDSNTTPSEDRKS